MTTSNFIRSSEMNELPADLTLLQQELHAVQYMIRIPTNAALPCMYPTAVTFRDREVGVACFPGLTAVELIASKLVYLYSH